MSAPGLDFCIRLFAFVAYLALVNFRAPFERQLGTWKYISAVYGNQEVSRNFAGLPEEAKRTIRRKMFPIYLVFASMLLLGLWLPIVAALRD